ncbi:MAG TPA: AAA family ATPase [Terriglobia bacterium]|nr:AAA family ATPase [Terriglobia bacterium]
MFLDYYRLHEQPFGVTPDPRFLYFSPSHREALASLYYGIETGRGFLALTAEPGMGKTTLLFHLLEKLRGSARTAFIFRTQCDSREFLRLLMADLGYSSRDDDPIRLQEQLNNILIREARSGSRCVLVVDEAQNLADPVLETVRMLSNFETSRAKLMQILLAGQPQLADKLASPNLIQLRQRVSILSRLNRLSMSETAGYINHRLHVAGYSGKLLFTPGALSIIASGSEGIPRNINNICFHALTLGFARQQRVIGAPLVEEVLADLDVTTLDSASASNIESTLGPSSEPGCPSLEEIMAALDTSDVGGSGNGEGARRSDSSAPQVVANQLPALPSVTADWPPEPMLSSPEAREEVRAASGGDRTQRPMRWTSRIALVFCLVLLAGLREASRPGDWKWFVAHAETTFRAAMARGHLAWKSSATSTPTSETGVPAPHPANAALSPASSEVASPQDPSPTSSRMAVPEAKADLAASPTITLPNAAVQPSTSDAARRVRSTVSRHHVAIEGGLRNRQRAELADKLAAATHYYDRGEYELALDLFEAALRIDPSSDLAKTGIMRAREARSVHARLPTTSRPAL